MDAMPSPFPGMNPYLEHPAVFADFHARLLVAVSAEIARQVRGRYVVKIDEQVYLKFEEDEAWGSQTVRDGRPGVAVLGGPRYIPPPGSLGEMTDGIEEGGVATIEAPVIATIPGHDEVTINRITILDRDGDEVITAIEVLSPVNKRPGTYRETYEHKRDHYLHSFTHFIELDLLRKYEPMPARNLPDCDYRITVGRLERRPRVEVWPVRLRDPLPVIGVPLKAGDADVPLNLMAAMHRTYDEAGYADYIYRREPVPGLHPEDAKWARGLIEGEVRAGAGVE